MGIMPNWAGWIRTNEMQESKSCALPLGDSPIILEERLFTPPTVIARVHLSLPPVQVTSITSNGFGVFLFYNQYRQYPLSFHLHRL